jgi:hypothetical protein
MGTAQGYVDDATYKAIGEQHLEDPPAWWSANPAKVVVTVVRSSSGDLPAMLAKSVSRNTGNIYVYDGQTGDYGHLSTLWDDLLAGLAGQPTGGGRGCLQVLGAAALPAAAWRYRSRRRSHRS